MSIAAFLLEISLDKDAQDAMARMFSSEQTACIHFRILGETEELYQCTNVGLCQVLHQLSWAENYKN